MLDLEQLRTPHDDTEQIAHIMHDTAGKLAEQFDTLGLQKLRFEHLLLRDVADIKLPGGMFLPHEAGCSDLEDGSWTARVQNGRLARARTQSRVREPAKLLAQHSLRRLGQAVKKILGRRSLLEQAAK